MRWLKPIFILTVIKPLVFIGLGLNIIQRQHLPQKGPAIMAANHNSHLDTLVLLALFPITQVHKVRPVAAADYFFTNKFTSWLSHNILGIIPLARTPTKEGASTMFTQCHQALDQDDILIIFPEGSRGKPEVMSDIKKGIFRLMQEHKNCPVIPVVMRGLGKALPKGTAMFVPFNCDVVIGEQIDHFENGNDFIQTMQQVYQQLSEHCIVTQMDE